MMMSRAPHVVAPPPVLRLDWETLAWLASRRSKPPDLDACPAPTSLRWFCGAIDKPKPPWLRPKLRNRRGEFEAQITKPELPVLRPKPGNCRPWFWGSTKKLVLSSPCARCRQHMAHGPLHQVSYYYLDPCRCRSCRTWHLHTTRQAKVILHMKQE
jgi:hypothetical protein